jgi:hypothetical protein
MLPSSREYVQETITEGTTVHSALEYTRFLTKVYDHAADSQYYSIIFRVLEI